MSNFQLPVVDFYFQDPGVTTTQTSKELFLGKRSVIFTVPGAFVSGCSTLSDYEKAYDDLIAEGVDQVFCVSVNDDFVMKAWAEHLGIKKVQLLPDGNGAFTQGAKAVVAKENMGMGLRAWRVALVVNENGVVESCVMEDGQRANAAEDVYEETKPAVVIEQLQILNANNQNAGEADANLEDLLKLAQG
jgi:peroxiredoxin